MIAAAFAKAVAQSSASLFAVRQDTNARLRGTQIRLLRRLHKYGGTYAIIMDMNKELIYPEECYAIRGAIYAVHNEMGNGFREEVYQQCLEREFACRNIPYSAKKELRIYYKGVPIEKTYIPDFFCFEKIIVEIKAVSELTNEHRSQLMNYLRLTNSRIGLLVNFASYRKAVVEQWAR